VDVVCWAPPALAIGGLRWEEDFDLLDGLPLDGFALERLNFSDFLGGGSESGDESTDMSSSVSDSMCRILAFCAQSFEPDEGLPMSTGGRSGVPSELAYARRFDWVVLTSGELLMRSVSFFTFVLSVVEPDAFFKAFLERLCNERQGATRSEATNERWLDMRMGDMCEEDTKRRAEGIS
jgi:hypothetical protein